MVSTHTRGAVTPTSVHNGFPRASILRGGAYSSTLRSFINAHRNWGQKLNTMGLFDKIFQSAPEENKLTQQEAFAGISVAMAGADGSIAESEWAGIVNYIRRLRLYDNFSGPAFDKLFDKLFKILKKDGASALVKASADALSDDLKLTAFACAVDIALADGVLEEEEKTIINQLAAALSIPEKTAISIIEVMIIKNKV